MAAQPDWERAPVGSRREAERVQQYVERVRIDSDRTRDELRRVYEAYAATQRIQVRRQG